METRDSASAWRDSVRRGYVRINAIASIVLMVVGWLSLDFAHFGPLLVVLSVLVAIMAWLVFGSQVAPRHVASYCLVENMIAGAYGLAMAGWLPTIILVMTAPPLVASMTHGRRFAIACALFNGAAFLIVGYCMSTGLLAAPPEHPSMTSLAPWVRITVLTTICWVVFALFSDLGVKLIERKITEQVETRAKLDTTQAAFVEAQRQETIAALAGGLAHDFNNTLMVIMSWAELLREAGDDEELQAEANASILTSAEQASTLARQLLGLGRKGGGTPEPVDLAGVLALSVASLRKLVPCDVQIRLDPRPVPLVLAEPSQLQQVILNLAINAKDAMPEGGELRFEVLERRDARDRLWSGFAVHDSGTGMDEQTQAEIFKPFFTTKGEGRGSGLGLASVATILEQLGGELELDSTLGVGTTFTIWLPARPDLQRKAARVEDAPVGQLCGHVLVVENEPQVCTFVARTFANLGLEVRQAHDGDQAMAHIEALASLDLLCTDGVMPGTKPSAFIERTLARFPDCEVLVCSSHLPDDLVRRQIALGRYAFLPKPFVASDLRRHAHALLAPANDAVA